MIGETCEETVGMIGDEYLRCGRPAVVLVQHRNREEGPYSMCLECGDHNIANRNAEALEASASVTLDFRERWKLPTMSETVQVELPSPEPFQALPAAPTKEGLATESLTWAQKAQGLRIVDRASYLNASHFLQSLKGLRNEVKKWFEPHIEAAMETKRKAEASRKGLADERDKMDAPLVEAEGYTKKLLLTWDDEQEARRLAEERRLQEAANREAEERTVAAAAALEMEARETGDVEMLAEAVRLLDEPIEAPVVVVKTDVPKVRGLSYADDWKAHPAVDIRKLARDVADGKAPVTFLKAHMPALNAHATQHQDTKPVGGVRFYNDRQVRARA